MVTASKVICLKDITPTTCANFTISIFPKKFFWDNRMICFLLLMLFMPVNLIAQEQNNPAILVAKYQKELTNVLISLCSHNYKVELGQLRDKKKYDEREKLGMQETEAFSFYALLLLLQIAIIFLMVSLQGHMLVPVQPCV